MMTRREFAKHLALLAAGAAAMPAQIAAFEKLYDINTKPLGEVGLIAVDDIAFGFDAAMDAAHVVEFYANDRMLYSFAINQRATFRYVAAPNTPMLATQQGFRWTVSTSTPGASAESLRGSIRYVDQSGVVRTHAMRGAEGRING